MLPCRRRTEEDRVRVKDGGTKNGVEKKTQTKSTVEYFIIVCDIHTIYYRYHYKTTFHFNARNTYTLEQHHNIGPAQW